MTNKGTWETTARQLLDHDVFVADVSKVFENYQAKFKEANTEDSLTRTVIARKIRGYIKSLRTFEKQRRDTTTKTLELFNLPSEKKYLALYRQGMLFDDVALRLLGLSTSDLDAQIANLCAELENSLDADKQFRKERKIKGTKELTFARRNNLIVPLMRVFKQHRLSFSVYADDGMGNPSQLVMLAAKLAETAGDKASVFVLGSIKVTTEFLFSHDKIS